MSYIMREMQIEDYDEMVALWESTPGMRLNAADSRENIARFLRRNPGLSFVATEDGRVFATMMCGHDGRRGFFYHVAVAVAHRRRGVGQQLVNRALDRLKEEGIQRCILFVLADNEIGQGFWWKIGWWHRADTLAFSVDVIKDEVERETGID